MAPASFLLSHFDRLAEAPGGLAKLRALIVQLGIQGKLVAQNKNDEPVANLLARIRSARPKLIAAGEAQKLKDLPETVADDLPFEIPDSWQWVRLAELAAYIQRGKSPVYEPGSTKIVLNQKCIQWDGLHLEYAKEVSGVSLERYEPVRFLRSGDILWNSTGTGTIGRCLVFRPTTKTPPKLAVDGHVTIVRTIEVEPDYIQRWLMSPFVYGVIEQRASGATNQVELTSTMSTEQLISLPPLAEQRRIVAKVEELMGLCDTLEAAQQEREAVRTRLRTSALHQLASPDSDSKSAAFVLQNLPRLTTEPEDLAEVRHSVLQLAVRGKLVSHTQTDESALTLLTRLKRAKVDGKKKRSETSDDDHIEDREGPFDIPHNWIWARFPEVGEFGRGKSKHRPRNDPSLYTNGKYPLVQTGDVARSGGRIASFAKRYNEFGLAQSKLWPRGTLCITIAANIADSGLLEFEACFPDSVVGFIPATAPEDARYFDYFIRTAKAHLLEFAPATAQKNINLEILNAVLIPLPPLAEQRRIVAKVDELMAVLDALAATLTTARTTTESLLAATIAKLNN